MSFMRIFHASSELYLVLVMVIVGETLCLNRSLEYSFNLYVFIYGRGVRVLPSTYSSVGNEVWSTRHISKNKLRKTQITCVFSPNCINIWGIPKKSIYISQIKPLNYKRISTFLISRLHK